MCKIQDLNSQLLFLSYSGLCETNYTLEMFNDLHIVFHETKLNSRLTNADVKNKLVKHEIGKRRPKIDVQSHERHDSHQSVNQIHKNQETKVKSPYQDKSNLTLDDVCQNNNHDLTVVSRDLSLINNLSDLKEYICKFTNCGLVNTATQAVFADGNPQADIMIIGEAPGAEEDKQGLPFVGRAGSLLNQVLDYVGLNRSQDVYIANVVPWRPPGNRTPTNYELDLCVLFVRKHIALCAAKQVILLGAVALRSIIGCREGIIRIRGQWFQRQFDDKNVKLLATYHPAFLLRQPIRRREFWRDFLTLSVKY